MIQPSLFLRRAIQADAIFSGASAVLLTFGAGALAPLLNLPEALLRETGLFLIAYAALVGWLGTRQAMPKALVAIVIAGNAAWTIASIALLFSGWVNPNLLGEIAVAIAGYDGDESTAVVEDDRLATAWAEALEAAGGDTRGALKAVAKRLSLKKPEVWRRLAERGLVHD